MPKDRFLNIELLTHLGIHVEHGSETLEHVIARTKHVLSRGDEVILYLTKDTRSIILNSILKTINEFISGFLLHAFYETYLLRIRKRSIVTDSIQTFFHHLRCDTQCFQSIFSQVHVTVLELKIFPHIGSESTTEEIGMIERLVPDIIDHIGQFSMSGSGELFRYQTIGGFLLTSKNALFHLDF